MFRNLVLHPGSISFVNISVVYQLDFHRVSLSSVSVSLHKPLWETKPSRRDKHLAVTVGRLKILLLQVHCSALVRTSSRQLSSQWGVIRMPLREWEQEMGSPSHCSYTADGCKSTVSGSNTRVCQMQGLDLQPLNKWWRKSAVHLSPKEDLYQVVKKRKWMSFVLFVCCAAVFHSLACRWHPYILSEKMVNKVF